MKNLITDTMKDLEPTEMVFELKNGVVLKISDATIKAIARKIQIDIITDLDNPNITLVRRFDTNMDKVAKMQDVLKSWPDMADDTRQEYYKEILVLVKTSGEIRDEEVKLGSHLTK